MKHAKAEPSELYGRDDRLPMITSIINCQDKVAAAAVVILFAVLFASDASGRLPRDVVTVRGRVVLSDGKPIPETQVFVVHRPLYHDFVLRSTTTDRSGAFSFSDVPLQKRVRFIVRHKGFALSLLQRIFLNPVQTKPLEIVVREAGIVQMKVEDPFGSKLSRATFDVINWRNPIPPATLEPRLAKLIGLRWPRSDSSGQLDLNWLPKTAIVTGHIRHTDFARAPFQAICGKSSPSVKLQSGVPFRLNITGRGVDVPQSGWQLSMSSAGDDSMLLFDHQFVLGRKAAFEMTVPAGMYSMIRLRHPDLQTVPGLITDRTLEGGQQQEVDISVTARATVTGRVIDTETGEPLADQKIEAYTFSPDHSSDQYGLGPGWFYSARGITNESGKYTLRPGVGSVRLAHRSRSWACVQPFVTVEVSVNQENTAPDIRLGRGVTLNGTVRDPHGNPVPRAVVKPAGAQAFHQPVISDEQGCFRYQVQEITAQNSNSSAGSIELFVFDPYRPLARQLKIPLDSGMGTVHLDVRLEKSPIVPPSIPPQLLNERPLVVKPAPSLKIAGPVNGFSGSPNIADHRGKFVLLHFWATWCGPCLKAMPTVEAAQNLYADLGLRVISIHHNSVTAEEVREFLKNKPSNHLHVMDADNGSTCDRYNIDGYPSYVLVDPNGEIVASSKENPSAFHRNFIQVLRHFLFANGNFDAQ